MNHNTSIYHNYPPGVTSRDIDALFDDVDETAIPDSEQWHPAIIAKWEADKRPHFDEWINKHDIEDINAIICEYTDTKQIVKLLIETKCYQIMTEQVGNVPDWEYYKYLVSISTIDGYEFWCNYESYEMWKTDIRG